MSTESVRTTDGAAIAALVLGILGFFVPIVPSVLAVIFGKHAYDKIQRDECLEGVGFARAGEILGWTALGLLVVIVLIAVFFLPA